MFNSGLLWYCIVMNSYFHKFKTVSCPYFADFGVNKMDKEERKMDAEIAEIIANTIKLGAETAKINNEALKVSNEALKINKETFWYPMALATGLVIAVGAVVKYIQ